MIDVGKLDNMPADAVETGFKEFEKYDQRVVEMVVSGWDGDKFRFPRFKKWRPDKTPRDCQFSEQIGKKRK